MMLHSLILFKNMKKSIFNTEIRIVRHGTILGALTTFFEFEAQKKAIEVFIFRFSKSVNLECFPPLKLKQ